MKKYFLMVLCLLGAAGLWGQGNCLLQDQVPLQLMSKELKRNFNILKKQKPPLYYLAYTYKQQKEHELSVAYDGVAVRREQNRSALEVQARAGSPRLDNTHALRGEEERWRLPTVSAPEASAQDPQAFRTVLWRLTQTAAEQAQQDWGRVVANVRSMAQGKDPSDDFVFPPKNAYCHEEPIQEIDLKEIEPLLLNASQLVRGKDFVLGSSFSFLAQQGHRYFADSRGTRLKTPYAYLRLLYEVAGRGADGLQISRTKIYDVSSVAQLPTPRQLQADVEKSLQELQQLSVAEEGEADSAPTLLKNYAAAVFVHEVMGHRLEAGRFKSADDGQTLAGKVGQQVIPPLITITADPTMKTWKGVPLRGHYEYDDEGVQARPVTLIENGVLKNFLMQSSPVQGFARSNGHGRKELGRRAEARMSVLRAQAASTVPYAELEKMLLEEIKRQGKPYGYIVEDLGGGYTLTGTSLPQSFKLETKLVYKVYPDGRKEAVRGLDVVGTPLASFNKILAAADDEAVFNGSCGARSGWVPQSNMAPSFLFESLEMQKSEKSDYKPPVLPAPAVKEQTK